MENISQEQLDIWKASIERYKIAYSGLFHGKRPSEKMIEAHCKIYNIPYPLPEVDMSHDATQADYEEFWSSVNPEGLG